MDSLCDSHSSGDASRALLFMACACLLETQGWLRGRSRAPEDTSVWEEGGARGTQWWRGWARLLVPKAEAKFPSWPCTLQCTFTRVDGDCVLGTGDLT